MEIYSIFNENCTCEGTTSTAAIHSFLAEAVGTVGRELGGDQPDLAVVASAWEVEAANNLLGQSLVGKGGDHRGDNQQTVHFGADECCVDVKILKIV